jgi:hypothetical protein
MVTMFLRTTGANFEALQELNEIMREAGGLNLYHGIKEARGIWRAILRLALHQ